MKCMKFCYVGKMWFFFENSFLVLKSFEISLVKCLKGGDMCPIKHGTKAE